MLRIRPFRRLWIVLGLSSLGDWLGLLATTLFAQSQVQGGAQKGLAFGGVVVVRLLPALILGPVAGAFADRFDRRLTMVVCDLLRFALFASIPIVGMIARGAGAVTWALIATFVIEVLAMFWIPAKEASVPNLVKERLEPANQLSLITTYGLTPVLAALLIAGLSRAMLAAVGDDASRLTLTPVDVALFLNAASFLASALVVLFGIHEISGRGGNGGAGNNLFAALMAGWRFVKSSRLVSGLVEGILGAFAAGGVVVGLASPYAVSLGGGDAAFGLLFGSLFIGLAAGMAAGPPLVKALSRRRWFGMSIVLAGVAVTLLAFVPHLAVALPVAFFVGVGAGMAYLAGITLLGGEIEDDMRGRAFAFVQSMVRVVLMLAIALSSVLVRLGGTPRVHVGFVDFRLSSTRLLLIAAGLFAILAGFVAFRRMDDKPGVPVLKDLISSLRGRPLPVPGDGPHLGVFVAFEGGEGAGKSTQAVKLAAWLKVSGYECVTTREPGATPLGRSIRDLLLRHDENAPTPRAEALLYAADRAQHVDTVIRPALERGAVVVTDRYVDSSLAYQGGGRGLAAGEVAWLSRWATRGLRPDLVVVLDVDPAVGLGRVGDRGDADRLEVEPDEFHRRVRQTFLDIAAEDPGRYLVVDASGNANMIAEQIRDRLAALLPERVAEAVR
ncbi:MAG: thymidylate kinase [Actinomycetia bacterium]|nr:thymidylate kinase [Actinomycetes bacterium]